VAVDAATGAFFVDQFADDFMRARLETVLSLRAPAELLLPGACVGVCETTLSFERVMVLQRLGQPVCE
jgi:hypothetical protein